jgi:hypothetical protein
MACISLAYSETLEFGSKEIRIFTQYYCDIFEQSLLTSYNEPLSNEFGNLIEQMSCVNHYEEDIHR